MTTVPLRPAPRRLADLQGRPYLGKFAGAPERLEVASLAARHRPPFYARLVREKRWVFVGLASDQVLLGLAAVDLGFASHGFFYAAELATGRVLCETTALGPPLLAARIGDRPEEGLAAAFRWGGLDLGVRRMPGAGSVGVRVRGPDGVRLDARLAVDGVEPLTVIAPVGPLVPGVKKSEPPRFGRVQTTVKRAGIGCSGTLTAGGVEFALDRALGGLDYSLGEPDRDTAWRWCMASGIGPDGKRIGFNFVEGFNEAPGIDESAIWVDGVLTGLPPVRFTAGEVEGRWGVESGCGAIRISFEAFHVHREETKKGPVESRFLQHLGRFSGVVAGQPVDGFAGVLEDQRVRW